MGKFVRGDIVVLNFPFSNLSGTKLRPALVLAHLGGNDLIICQITSRNKLDSYSVLLEDADYINGKLSVESVVRPDKLFTAEEKLILYTACKIKEEKLSKIINSLINIIKCENRCLNIEKTIYELEMDFMRFDFCRYKDRLAARIFDDFIEFQQSGGKANKEDIINSLSQITEDRNIVLSDFNVNKISDNSFLATYIAKEITGRISNRSSIWKDNNGQWKILFHQGTTVPHEKDRT